MEAPKIWKGPCYIGTQKFITIKECEQYVRDKIGTEPRKIRRDNEQFYVFKQLLKNHSEYKDKKGVGINYFEFIINPTNKKAMHGTIIRKNGTTVDFSWLGCCRNNRTKLTDNTLSIVMRQAIKKDTIEFKKKQPTLICSLCNIKELSYSDYHVDHNYPPFRDIRKEFLELQKISPVAPIPTTFSICPKSKCPIFNDADEYFERCWYEFHQLNANYQILCSTCNLKKH